MNIKGGALEFDIIANNGQINSALEETKKRVKGFTDATVEGGDKMEAAYKKAAETIEAAWKDIDTMTNTHQGAIAELEKEYAKLGEAAVHAFQKGTAKGDEEYGSLTQKQQVVQAEINQRKQLLQEIRTTADALLKEEQTLNTNKAKVEQNTQAKAILRTQVMNLKNSLAEMEQAGKRDTDEFRAMQVELGRLQDAMTDANTQAKIMSDDYRNLNTAVEVIGGVTGAFSAAQGAVGLFAGENENLQKIMVKVQSLMAITIGLQQVSKTLNKDSYTQLVLVRRAKELLTVAEAKFATALGISNVMAKALMATLTLGLSVAITAIVVVLDRFITKNREAKKAQEEFNKKVSDTAASSIANFNALSYAWGQLGNNLEAKQKFVEQNADKFKELGFTINTVKQAEDLLVANGSRFVEALMQRAKATATAELAVEQYKKVIEAQNTLDRTPKAYVSKKGTYTDGYGTKREGTITVKDSKWQEAEDDLAKQQAAYEKLIAQQATFTAEEKKILASIGADSATITEGSINALEDQINKLQAKYKEAGNDQERAKYLKQIQATQKTLDKITAGSKKTPGGSSTSKNSDPYLSQLEERKKKYTEYYNWVNSKDDIVGKAAQTEFAGLLSEGSNYLDYLKKQREQLSQKIGDGSATKAQTEKLHKLNNAIAEETKDTVLAEFEKELQNQLNGTNSILEMLNVLEEKRKALQDDKSGLKQEKTEVVDKQESTISEDSAREAEAAQKELQKYYDSKINFEERYLVQRKALELKAENETDTARKAIYQNVISALDSAHTLKNVTDYDALAQEYRSYEQKRADIAADYDKKIALARANSNSELEATLIQQKEKEQLANSFEELKGSPEYIRAFEDLKNTSSETLNVLLAKMEEVKSSAAENLSPEDLRAYTDTMFTIVSELNERDPFTAVKKGYKELKAAERELAAAERELAAVRGRGAAGTAEESQAINKVNAAKDKYLKKNNQVKISERTAINSVKALSDEMSNLGSAVGGEAGEIISLIGDVGSFTMSAISGFGTASKASATAIKTVEKASVILAIIGAAIQLATKVASLFANDNAEYDKAKESYESYIKVLDEVIAKQKELVETMAGENAVNSYKYAISLIEKSAEAARELGKQRLNAGASAGSHSYGVRQRKKMDSNDWAAAASALGGAYDSSISSGRMTGLFDLTAEQLEKLKSEAPTFWAKLDSDAQEYLQAIIDSNASLEEMKDSLNESLTGVSFDSLSDDFLETLTDMDMNAKTFASQFSEYMRKALIQNMFKSQYQSQLEKWYQMWSDAMNPDSAGGSAITAEEQSALDTLKNSIINGAIAGAEAINQQFETETEPTTTLSGAISSASQESIDLLAGQTNAVRVNQVESIEILRQQLIHLASIDSKVGTSNKYLEAIEKNTAANNSDPLRAQGITN